jgi:hypothetical protein|nr:MAG TPA: hypothetical protein [Caudoviricetes sp.]
MMSESTNTERSLSFEEKLKRFMKVSKEIQRGKMSRQNEKVCKKRKKLPARGLEDR